MQHTDLQRQARHGCGRGRVAALILAAAILALSSCGGDLDDPAEQLHNAETLASQASLSITNDVLLCRKCNIYDCQPPSSFSSERIYFGTRYGYVVAHVYYPNSRTYRLFWTKRANGTWWRPPLPDHFNIATANAGSYISILRSTRTRTNNDTCGGTWTIDAFEYGNKTVRVLGGSGVDNFYGGNGPDVIRAGTGNDYVRTYGGRDDIFAEGGNDFVDGGDDGDRIRGNGGNDTLLGNDGNDWIYNDGGLGTAAHGGNGNDCVDIPIGDYMNCGPGNDRYGHANVQPYNECESEVIGSCADYVNW